LPHVCLSMEWSVGFHRNSLESRKTQAFWFTLQCTVHLPTRLEGWSYDMTSRNLNYSAFNNGHRLQLYQAKEVGEINVHAFANKQWNAYFAFLLQAIWKVAFCVQFTEKPCAAFNKIFFYTARFTKVMWLRGVEWLGAITKSKLKPIVPATAVHFKKLHVLFQVYWIFHAVNLQKISYRVCCKWKGSLNLLWKKKINKILLQSALCTFSWVLPDVSATIPGKARSRWGGFVRTSKVTTWDRAD